MNVLAALAAAVVGAVLAWGTKTWRERRAVKERDELILRRAADTAEEREDEALDYLATFYKDYSERDRDAPAAEQLGLRDEGDDGESVPAEADHDLRTGEN